MRAPAPEMPLPQKTKMGTDSPASISAAKNQLRKTIHTSLATLSKKEICSASEKIGDTAIKTMEWNDASVLPRAVRITVTTCGYPAEEKPRVTQFSSIVYLPVARRISL